MILKLATSIEIITAYDDNAGDCIEKSAIDGTCISSESYQRTIFKSGKRIDGNLIYLFGETH